MRQRRWVASEGYPKDILLLPQAHAWICRCTFLHEHGWYTHVHVYICKDIRQGGRHMTEDNAVTKYRTWVNEHTVGLLYTSQCKSVEKHRKRFAVLGSSFKELSPHSAGTLFYVLDAPLSLIFVLDAPLSLIFGQYFKNLPEARQIRQGGERGIKTSSCLLFIFFQVGLWCFPVLLQRSLRTWVAPPQCTPLIHQTLRNIFWKPLLGLGVSYRI